MSNIFLVSDLHLGHVGVTKFLRDDGSKLRPWDTTEEMDEALIENWNRVVRPQDTVYNLGDVVINRKALKTLERLNGDKVLVKGNHDILRPAEYLTYFRDIRGSHKLEDILLTHIPIHPDSLARWCGGNAHGHLHSNRVRLADGSIDPRYFCVSVEHIDYTPMEYEELKKRIKEQQDTPN